MLSHYGWLMIYGDVDGPSIEAHGGDAYIHKDDVVDGNMLCPGDVVNFYLYVDDKGLGAEMCQVEEKGASRVNPMTADSAPSDDEQVEHDEIGLTTSARDFAARVSLESMPN